jgi:hypothetical protein
MTVLPQELLGFPAARDDAPQGTAWLKVLDLIEWVNGASRTEVWQKDLLRTAGAGGALVLLMCGADLEVVKASYES